MSKTTMNFNAAELQIVAGALSEQVADLEYTLEGCFPDGEPYFLWRARREEQLATHKALLKRVGFAQERLKKLVKDS